MGQSTHSCNELNLTKLLNLIKVLINLLRKDLKVHEVMASVKSTEPSVEELRTRRIMMRDRCSH